MEFGVNPDSAKMRPSEIAQFKLKVGFGKRKPNKWGLLKKGRDRVSAYCSLRFLLSRTATTITATTITTAAAIANMYLIGMPESPLSGEDCEFVGCVVGEPEAVGDEVVPVGEAEGEAVAAGCVVEPEVITVRL